MGGGLDWPGLMRAGLRGLGLRPEQFWALTPAELALMLGVDAGPPAMTRSRLAELAARFPDRAAPPCDSSEEGRGDGGQGRVRSGPA